MQIVIGAGPVGATIANQLAEVGERVRVLTRSGSGPEHPLVERLQGDATSSVDLDRAFVDADVVFDCMHGSRYTADAWRAELPAAEATVLAAAERAGATVVFPESLYAYAADRMPMTEDSPRTATTGKRGVRTQLLAARAAAATPTVSVVASDFYGPLARNAHAGERMVPTVLAGRTMRVVGDPDVPHSWTYVPDLAAAMIRAAATPSAHGRVLHAPTAAPVSQRELVGAIAAAAGVPAPKVSGMPVWLLRALGLVSRDLREVVEMSYQFTAPFVMESTHTQELLGLAPTPLEVGVKETVDWWRRVE